MNFSFSDVRKKLEKIFKSSNIERNLTKIKLSNNKPLDDDEYNLVCKLCDIFIAIREVAGVEIIAPPVGGVFWDKAKPGMGPFDLYMRKDRKEIDHLFLLFNAFRDFCALAYEYDEYTPTPDFWIRRYMRLANAVPARWRVRQPARFGEIGWGVDGYPINRWTSVNQERINAMTIAGITKYLEQQDSAQILEVGAGAGEMGYALCKALPNCSWFDADLLGCLAYSAIQLSINLPEKRHAIYVGNLKLPNNLDERLLIRTPEEAASQQNAVVYIPSFMLDDFKGILKLHFAYNTYSFGEMPKTAVMHYADLLVDFLKDQGVLFEQNGYFPERGGDNAQAILSSKFEQLKWPQQLDGRWLPNGPTHVWQNNGVGEKIQKLISIDEINQIIESLKDMDDTVDIQYPNEIMWPKVYELFQTSQRVTELFPWATS